MRARRGAQPLASKHDSPISVAEFLRAHPAGEELDLGPQRGPLVSTDALGIIAVFVFIAAVIPGVWLVTAGAAQTANPAQTTNTATPLNLGAEASADPENVVELEIDGEAPKVDAEYLTESLLSDEQLSAFEERRQQIHSRQLETESELVILDSDLEAMRARIERYEFVMANQELVIDNAQKTRTALEAYKTALEVDMSEVEAEIVRLINEQQKNAVDAYMEPTVTSLPAVQIVLTSDPFDISTVVRRLGLVGAVADHQAEIVLRLRERNAQLAENRILYDEVVADWEASYAEETQTIDQLEANRLQHLDLVAQLEQTREATLNEQETLAADAQQLEQEIAERNQQLIEIAERRAAQKEKCAETGGDIIDEGQEIRCNFWTSEGFSGKFVPPAQGGISSPYGMRQHPIYGDQRMHDGDDYNAPAGSPIVAAAPGEVYFVGWMAGYGNTTMIDHGNGLSTLYAHQSGFKVVEGQMVSAGDEIGYVGSTGNSTGPHLHFEAHLNGQPVNPATYF